MGGFAPRPMASPQGAGAPRPPGPGGVRRPCGAAAPHPEGPGLLGRDWAPCSRPAVPRPPAGGSRVAPRPAAVAAPCSGRRGAQVPAASASRSPAPFSRRPRSGGAARARPSRRPARRISLWVRWSAPRALCPPSAPWAPPRSASGFLRFASGALASARARPPVSSLRPLRRFWGRFAPPGFARRPLRRGGRPAPRGVVAYPRRSSGPRAPRPGLRAGPCPRVLRPGPFEAPPWVLCCGLGSPLPPPARPPPLGAPGGPGPILGGFAPRFVGRPFAAPLAGPPSGPLRAPGAAARLRLTVLKLSTGVLHGVCAGSAAALPLSGGCQGCPPAGLPNPCPLRLRAAGSFAPALTLPGFFCPAALTFRAVRGMLIFRGPFRSFGGRPLRGVRGRRESRLV